MPQSCTLYLPILNGLVSICLQRERGDLLATKSTGLGTVLPGPLKTVNDQEYSETNFTS